MDYYRPVPCAKYPGEQKTVYLVEIENGLWYSSGCEDMDGSDICRECRERVVKVTRERLNP